MPARRAAPPRPALHRHGRRPWIGAEIARTFAREGAELGVLDVAADVKAVAAELSAAVEIVDLADHVAAGGATANLISALGGVDVLVNNAGSCA